MVEGAILQGLRDPVGPRGIGPDARMLELHLELPLELPLELSLA